MKPTTTLAEVLTPRGSRLSLRLHDGQYAVCLDGRGLMSTTATASEARLAELGCERLGAVAGSRVLIGGLGLGFTLRRALEVAPADAQLEVVELYQQIVDWNRQHLQAVNGALLDDARVSLRVAEVGAVLARAPARHYHVVLLDVDNGPDAFVDRRNQRLYASQGLIALRRALVPGGRAVFWSAGDDPAFLERLRLTGFQAQALAAAAYPAARRRGHTLFVADWRG